MAQVYHDEFRHLSFEMREPKRLTAVDLSFLRHLVAEAINALAAPIPGGPPAALRYRSSRGGGAQCKRHSNRLHVSRKVRRKHRRAA